MDHHEQSLLKAFHHKNFLLFFVGQSISLIGTWSQTLAISWLVWRLTSSAVWLGAIGFMLQIPMLILGIPGGVIADRYDRLRLLTLAQILCMIQAVLLAMLTIFGIVKLWEVVILSVFLGSVYAFEFPLRQAFVMDMVGKKDLLNAVSLNAAMIHGTRIAGPVAAGVIVAWKGEGTCFLFNAATFIALISALLVMDRSKLIIVKTEHKSFRHSISEMFLHSRSEPNSRFSLILVGVVTLFGFPYVTLLPIFADRVYGGGAVYLGWLMGASGTGALLGALWLARRRTSSRLILLSCKTAILFSAAIILFSQQKSIWMALPTLALAGFFLTITFSGTNTILQHHAPDHLRGRMMSMYTIAFMGFTPFGSLIGGFLAHFLGAPYAMSLCGACCFILCGFIFLKVKKLIP